MFLAARQFDSALQVVERLRAAGHQAYFAGGCVRDLLLGHHPKDFDVATSATPDVVLGLFERTFAVGAHFGVVLVADGDEEGYVTTEVATFRSDGAYSDGRHPDAVRYTTSAEEDVKRRDFTINGLLLDPNLLFPEGLKPSYSGEFDVRAKQAAENLAKSPIHSGSVTGYDFSRAASAIESPWALALAEASADATLKNTPLSAAFESATPPAIAKSLPNQNQIRSAVIDYVAGLADLEAGVVRAIGRAHERFEEDHLRMLRAVRFAARLGFDLEAQTRLAVRSLAPKIAAVSRERVRDELTRMLTEGSARRAFELLDETGLLAEVLPEVAKMKGVEQPPQYHPEGDVWVHTLGLLGQLEAGCSMTLAWGALLHDVGKPPTFRRAPDRIRFDGHVEVGVAMAAEICRRFRFSNEETRQTLALVDNHMRFADAQYMRASTLKRFFRLPDFEEHLALHRMDCMAGSGNLDHWQFVSERWLAMPEETVRPVPLLTGRELIAAGYAPGAAFKQMLRAVEDAQLEGTITTAEEALQLVQDRFK